MIKTCEYCGEEFTPKMKSQKYCSSKCRKQARNKRKRDARLKEKKCGYCGKTFMGNDKSVYCCSECAKKSKQDYMADYHRYRYWHDEEYRLKKQESSVGTFNLQSNLNKNGERDWEREAELIAILKRQVGLK